ncbi:hypothetical protein K474DRAFT_1674351 [Panus rudis PR-1116 ss-1]|nr:hypothetical protein K474DRAFT_1674351 [Panus rudis PR-1116 ss-1]
MDTWPSDGTRKVLASSKRRRRKVEKDAEERRPSYPSAETGALTAASLVRKGNRLNWTFLSSEKPERRLVETRSPTTIFPATRPLSLHSSLTAFQQTEQTTHFIRTHYPDVEFASEIIRENIAESSSDTAKLSNFDPYRGNVVNAFSYSRSDRKLDAYLAFSVGETGCDLNISSFQYARTGGTTFSPSAEPVWSSMTPIQQIVSCSPDPRKFTSIKESYLAVRTFAQVTVLSVTFPRKNPHQAQVTEIGTVLNGDVGKRPIVDALLSKTSNNGVNVSVVNDLGQPYEFTFSDGATVSAQVYAPTDTEDKFYQVAQGPSDTTRYLLSGNTLRLLDIRAKAVADDIYSKEHLSDYFTYMEPPRHDDLIRLATTREVLWIDPKYVKRPLFSIKHSRRYDRNLRLETMMFGNIAQPLTFLTSTQNSLVSIYDVSRDDSCGSLVHIKQPTCTIQSPLSGNSRNLGHTFFRHPNDINRFNVSFIQMSDRGSLHRSDFQLHNVDATDQAEGMPGEAYRWSEEVQQIKDLYVDKQEDPGPQGERLCDDVDLSLAYQELFCKPPEPRDTNPDAVYDLLDVMPKFWKRLEEPVEYALTTFDAAFRSGSEPHDPARADFFTGTPLDSIRGYRALKQDRIPRKELIKQSPAHWNILPIARRFVPDISGEAHEMLEHLSRYDLAYDDNMPAAALRRETEAREQLALDLALSSDVFLGREVQPGNNGSEDLFESMSRATEAMSIGVAEPPDVKFTFLQPTPKRTLYRKDDSNEEETVGETSTEDDATAERFRCPLGVRLLLSEWSLGADPQSYVYQDPYDSTAPPAFVPRGPQPRDITPTDPAASQPVTSQRPPTIAVVTRPPVIASSQPTRAHPVRPSTQPGFSRLPQSQDNIGGSQPIRPSSQQIGETMMPSTQVLPGPYGGRTAAPVKKKPAKKRIGGPSNSLFNSAALNETLRNNKAVVCALSASYISTFAGYPLDSIKSRLQTIRQPISIPKLAALVYREEGIVGFYRGLWIPLMTISFVRAASFTIYSRTKEYFREHHWLTRNRILDVAAVGGIGGALSGSLISFGSAQPAAFELVKVRRQLEYSIAASKGLKIAKPPSTLEAVREIFRSGGLMGLYTGFRLHFALYFFEYDGLRHIMGRYPSGEQGPTPTWLPIPESLVPFFCGSLAGVTSWALIYPLDVRLYWNLETFSVKTKVQQRALAGERYRPPLETLRRLVRGPDPNAPKPILLGLTRIYRGLGVSALRSVTTHGLLWTFFDLTASYIDALPGGNGK